MLGIGSHNPYQTKIRLDDSSASKQASLRNHINKDTPNVFTLLITHLNDQRKLNKKQANAFHITTKVNQTHNMKSISPILLNPASFYSIISIYFLKLKQVYSMSLSLAQQRVLLFMSVSPFLSPQMYHLPS